MQSSWLSPLLLTAAWFLVAGISVAVADEGSSEADRRAENSDTTKSRPFSPTDQYETRKVEGWTVLIDQGLIKNQPKLAEQAIVLLSHQLYEIGRKIPPGPLAQLRKVRFWVELAEKHNPCMTYHPSADWLREHGLNPEKAGCVEISNVRNFLSWTLEQPWMVLHELAHAYHHRFLGGGFENPDVLKAYQRALNSKLYDSVLRINGKDERAYAATNPKEFFAEVSESFFGTNDFYPFVTSELKRHDPETFALLKRLWHVK